MGIPWKSGTPGELDERSPDKQAPPDDGEGKGGDRLTTAELQDRCRATRGDLVALQGLVTAPKRHSIAILNALTLKWAYGHGKPVQRSESTGPASIGQVNIQVINTALELPPAELEQWLATGILPRAKAKVIGESVVDVPPTPKAPAQ